MVKKLQADSPERLEKFIQHLEDARQLQQNILNYGLEAAHLYVEDIDGDWLEKWGEDVENLETAISARTMASHSIIKLVTSFLESDDLVAVKVRDRLRGRSLCEIAAELEKCRSIPEENDQRLFAVKTVLADNIAVIETNRDASDIDDETSLLDLAEHLLEKLAEIWDDRV